MDGLDQPGGEMSFVHDYLDSACDDMSQNNLDPATIAVTAVLRQLLSYGVISLLQYRLRCLKKVDMVAPIMRPHAPWHPEELARQERHLRLLLQTWRLNQAKKRE